MIIATLQEGLTALYKASQKGNTKIVELLLKAGAHIEQRNNVSVGVPKHFVAQYRMESMIFRYIAQ